MRCLPILDAADVPVCGLVSGGLSAKQVLVAQQMRALKSELRAVRAELTASGVNAAVELRERESELRCRWRGLVRARDDAWRTKMRALGHEV